MNKVKSLVGYTDFSIGVLFLIVFAISISCKDKKDNPVPAPTITSISPDNAKPGAEITINGTNFNSDKTKDIVKFGSATATVSSATATILTAQVPGTLIPGAVKVTVSTGDGTSNEANFTALAVDAGLPQITSITPGSGTVGSTITISGTNFGATNTIKFTGTTNSNNTTAVTVTGTSPLQVSVPTALIAGSYNVTLDNGSNTSATVLFNVVAAMPIIASFSPDSVSKDQILTISGSSFNNVDSVTINGVKQTINSITATSISLKISAKTFSGKLVLYQSGTPINFTKNVGYKETYTYSTFSTYGTASNIFIDKNDCVYLAANRDIVKLSSSGDLLETLVTQDTTYFKDVLVRANGDILVTGQTGGSIMKVTGKNLLQSIYSFKTFANIYLTENANQEVFFSTTTDNKVYKLNNGTPVAFTPALGYIADITSDAQNNIYLTNNTNHTLVKLNSAGIATEMANYQDIGYGGVGFNAKYGAIYIGEESKLVKYIDATHYLTVPTGAYHPYHVAFTSKGDLIVSSTVDNYLIKITIE